jgi:hypothetical protein
MPVQNSGVIDDSGHIGRQGGRATGRTPQASALDGFLREP